MVLALIPFGFPAAAQAKILSSSDAGFAVAHEATVQAKPEEIWAAMIEPAKWWSGAHSWSGKAENFFLTVQPGGCFCEALPDGGFAEHARVIYAQPSHMLRLSGALGPLQSEALTGTLSIEIKPADGGTRISFHYVVGGYARFDLVGFAGAVDGVIGEQHARLTRLVSTSSADPAK
jgi:uncharacterized protein YndB with AHSA1/START domain